MYLTPFRRNSLNPFRLMDEIEKRFFDLDRNFFDFDLVPATGFRTDIKDNGDSYLLEAELPGFDKKDIKIEANDHYLTISAERKSSSEEKNDKYVRMERTYGAFRRSFDVSDVKIDDIKAEYENGILKLTLPKKEEVLPKSRTIEIK